MSVGMDGQRQKKLVLTRKKINARFFETFVPHSQFGHAIMKHPHYVDLDEMRFASCSRSIVPFDFRTGDHNDITNAKNTTTTFGRAFNLFKSVMKLQYFSLKRQQVNRVH